MAGRFALSGSTPPPRLSLPVLTPVRERVLAALVDLCEGDPAQAAAALEVPKSQLDLVDLDARARTSPTARADQVYSGVLYDALSPATLSSAARRRATARLMVTSSLFGLVGMAGLVGLHRLENLAAAKIGFGQRLQVFVQMGFDLVLRFHNEAQVPAVATQAGQHP